MKKGEATRARMVGSAAKLFEQQGYAATGLKQMLSDSGSPRGSFYFHFPGGKEDVAVAVVEDHAKNFGAMLALVMDRAPTAQDAAELTINMLAAQVTDSGCASGCPVTAITLEMANRSQKLQASARAAFEQWRQRIATQLQHEGHSPARAQATARVLLCAIEGALIMCRAYGDRGPLDDLKAQLEHLLAR